MSLEDYADKIGEDLSQRPVPLIGLDVLPDVGDLRTAKGGDSISSILGTSNPAAIGAFMEANGLQDSGLRAAQSYLIPRRADLADAAFAGLGQAALNADNARPLERARILPGDAVTVQPGAAVFDPQKGILATQPQRGASGSFAGEGYRRGANRIGIAGEFVDGFNLQNDVLSGLLDKGRAARKIGIVAKPLGAIAGVVEDGLEGVAEYKEGASGADVAVGVLGKTAIKGIASGAAGIIGAFTGPFAPAAIPLLSYTGGKAADYFLDDKSNAALGRKCAVRWKSLAAIHMAMARFDE